MMGPVYGQYNKLEIYMLTFLMCCEGNCVDMMKDFAMSSLVIICLSAYLWITCYSIIYYHVIMDTPCMQFYLGH